MLIEGFTRSAGANVARPDVSSDPQHRNRRPVVDPPVSNAIARPLTADPPVSNALARPLTASTPPRQADRLAPRAAKPLEQGEWAFYDPQVNPRILCSDPPLARSADVVHHTLLPNQTRTLYVWIFKI